jgi:hypothetical protein
VVYACMYVSGFRSRDHLSAWYSLGLSGGMRTEPHARKIWKTPWLRELHNICGQLVRS